MRYGLVVPAAGGGRRLGGPVPKQYQTVAGRSMLEHSLHPFLGDADCIRICVVVSVGNSQWPAIAARLANSRVGSAPGGAERVDSVRNGLAALAQYLEPDDWVLVHDAARPCVSRAEIDALKSACAGHAVGGLLATPLADTLKRAQHAVGQSAAVVAATLDRDGLWRALTPQMFRYRLLQQALAPAALRGRTPTDEAQAIEWLGQVPLLVPGSTLNLKVTTNDDLALAEALLAARIQG